MIEYIKGKMVELEPTDIVVETFLGVAYRCLISLQSYSSFREDATEDVKVYIHHYIREDEETYYGFYSKDERSLFRLLLSASGVGASTARLMLSSLSSDELRNAIISEDINKIKSIKGIGLKTAQRLIVDLKDKIVKGGGADLGGGALQAAESGRMVDEATAALLILGFAKPAVQKVVSSIIKDNPKAQTEDIIRLALQRL